MADRYWVIKGRPNRNDLASWLEPGVSDSWGTKRPPSDWQMGDRLFFWEAAPKTQVVGIGEIKWIPLSLPERGELVRFGVRYLSSYLSSPVHIDQARKLKELAGAVFLKSGAAGTLFRLTAAQARALFSLVAKQNEEVRAVWPRLARLSRDVAVPDVDETVGSLEGRRRLRTHFARERDPELRAQKLREVLRRKGRLMCEICGFDFASTYGSLGTGFCEVHHLQPLSRVQRPARTRLTDLAVVCSNCHRMLHRSGKCRPLATVRRALRHVV